MKKITILFVAVIACFSLKADPITFPLPPIITEIYFDSTGNWILEFYNWNYYYNPFNFDSIIIETSSGTSAFKRGIIDIGDVVIITKDSLVNPLNINRNGDYIKLVSSGTMLGSGLIGIPSDFIFYFGNYQNSYISPINSKQSYKMVSSMTGGGIGGFYYFIKEDSPSFGIVKFSSNSRGTFAGNVLDCNSLPIPNAKIEVMITGYDYYDTLAREFYNINLYSYYDISADNNGHFNDTNLYGRNYVLKYYSGDKNWLYDTSFTIAIEPDSINNFNFIIGCKKTLVGIKEIKPQDIELTTYPNPTSDKTTISIMLKNEVMSKNAIIKIFTSEGDLIKILPVEGVKPNEQRNIILNLSEYPQGHYYYNLELDGKKVATRKIIVVR